MFGDGAGRYEYLGSSPWGRSDASGLSWQESYEGVALPIISVLDGAVGFGLVDALSELLDGYRIAIKLAGCIGGYASTQEDMADWAMDFDRNDYQYSTTTLGGTDIVEARMEAAQAEGPSMAGRRGRPSAEGWKEIRAVGDAGERAYQKETPGLGKRCIGMGGPPPTPGKKRRAGRHYDNHHPDTNTYVEIKTGNQELTMRMKRQILKDKRIMDSTGYKIQWVFYQNGNNKVSQDVINFLKNLNFPKPQQRILDPK